MAIQFRCSGCGQAIEVDDQFATRLVACPFCQAAVQAPAASQLDMSMPVATPGAGAQAPGAPISTPISPLRPPTRAGSNPAWLCTLGMICGLCVPLNMCLMMAVFTAQSPEMMPRIEKLAREKASQAEQQALIQEELVKWTRENRGTFGTIAFGLAAIVIGGLASSIAGLIRAQSRKWQAIVGLVMCGVCGGCIGLGMIGQFAGAAGS